MNVWLQSNICAEAERQQRLADRAYIKSVNPKENGPTVAQVVAYVKKATRPVSAKGLRRHFRVTRTAILESLVEALKAGAIEPRGKASFVINPKR